jgi:hypothetical protein
VEKVRNTTMPNEIERKRLKKKMLDRWENEGGRIAADSVIGNQDNSASKREDEGDQAPASNDTSRVGRLSSNTKRRRRTQK